MTGRGGGVVVFEEPGGDQRTPRTEARERALFDSAGDVFDHPTLEGKRADEARGKEGALKGQLATDPLFLARAPANAVKHLKELLRSKNNHGGAGGGDQQGDFSAHRADDREGSEAASTQANGHHGAHVGWSRARLLGVASLSFGSLGVVFGDLGTSPLYTYASLFQDSFGEQGVPTADDVRGGLACLVWALILSSTLKYQLFMMSANFHGQGGIFALLNSLKWSGNLHDRPLTWRLFQGIAIVGVALMTADGMLTSSVSVTSAIEGLGLSVPAFNGLADKANYRHTNLVSAGVLCLVFALQAAGSHRIGFLYAPVMATWLVFILVVGAYNVAKNPDVLRAWSPAQLVNFWTQSNYKGTASWRSLGGIVLCLTGSEALFADMSHFGRGPIAVAWFFLVFPALVLQYTGQSAYLLRHIAELSPDPADGPDCAAVWFAGGACSTSGLPQSCCDRYVAAQDLTSNSFWHALPGRATYSAMVAIAMLASIVGSQSVITGVFTIYSQAAGLGMFPAIEVRQTSADIEGQVYCPGANRAMFVCVLIIVGAFQHASNLTAVFGANVALAFLCDSALRLGVARYCHGWHWAAVAAVGLPLFFMDGALASANVAKYFTAGPVLLGEGDANGRTSWIAFIPLIICVICTTMMAAWLWGRRILLLDAARRTAAIMELGRELQRTNSFIRERGGVPDASQSALVSALAAVRGHVPSTQDLAGLVEQAAPTQGEGLQGDEGSSESAVKPAHKVKSFQLEVAPLLGNMHDASTHQVLGSALAHLVASGTVARTPAVSIFLFSGSSLLDSEPLNMPSFQQQLETPDDDGDQPHNPPLAQPLELPHALLHSVISSATLPGLTLLMVVEFTPGLPYLPPSRRVTVHRIAPPGRASALPGVFQVVIRYGFAERPRSEADLCDMLLALGTAACEPSSSCGELAALAHLPCSLHGLGYCTCATPGAPAACLPVSFVVSQDTLSPTPGVGLPKRLAAATFNGVAAIASSATFLKLPTVAVSELAVHVPLNPAPSKGSAAVSGSGHESERKPRARDNATLRMVSQARLRTTNSHHVTSAV
jgi:KUP system potassium uptake protein